MEDITKNPFRILGLDVNCSLRDAARAEEELRAAVRLGVTTKAGCDPLSALAPIGLTPEVISQCRYSLQEPKLRGIAEFFWFIFNYSSSDQVRNSLQKLDVEAARRLLQAEMTSEDPEAVRAAAHDLGLLELLTADDSDDAETAAKHYQRALGLLAASRQAAGKDEISKAVSEKVLGAVAQRAREFVDDGELCGASCIYGTLLDCHWDSDDIRAVLGLPFGDLFRRVETSCKDIKRLCNTPFEDNSGLSSDLYDDLKSQYLRKKLITLKHRFDQEVADPLDVITSECEFHACDIEPVCDAALDCGRSLSIALHNELSESVMAYEMLVRLSELPASDWKLIDLQSDIRAARKFALMREAMAFEKDNQWREAIEKYREALSLIEDPENQAFVRRHIDHCTMATKLGDAPRPVDNSPCLQTWNGVGCTFYGSSKPDSDGSYVTTHWFVVLAIPIFALARYLVRPSHKGGYYILGKLPLQKWQNYWNLIVAACIVIGFIVMASSGGNGYSGYSGSGTGSSTYSTQSGVDATSGSDTGNDSVNDTSTSERLALADSIEKADAQIESWKSQMQELKSQLEDKKAQLQGLKDQLKPLESIADSEFATQEDIRHFNSLVDEHNSVLRRCRQLLKEHNQLVDDCNALVKKRNADLQRLREMGG